jgi:ubiquinone/menaquinone biosynthesis C-methylase UbiE
MEQVRRVLKPGGTFLFVEHILPADGIARPLFNAVTPVWKRIAGGCHLNRETLSTIRDSGLHIDELQYFAGSTFAYGSATKPGTPEPAGAHGV